MNGAAKGFAGGVAVTGLCVALAGGTAVSGPLVGVPLVIFCAPLVAATPTAAAVGAAKAIPEKKAKEIDDSASKQITINDSTLRIFRSFPTNLSLLSSHI